MSSFLDIHQVSLNKTGEELCGDQVRVVKLPEATHLILSDGMGSGVKANILATLTSEIIATLLRQQVSLPEIIDTVIRTLPVDKERRIAYATFSILTVNHADHHFRVVNFDNPAPIFIHNGKFIILETKEEKIGGKRVTTSSGNLGMGDFIGLLSDGVLHAAPGNKMDLGWNWQAVGCYLEDLFASKALSGGKIYSAHSLVNSLTTVTNQRYHFEPGDDATFVGLLRRERNTLMLFTGPPLDTGYDYIPVERFLSFPGRKVISGGSTANMIASFLKAKVKTDLSSQTETIPPIGSLPGIDLVTEGIFTLSGVLEAFQESQGQIERLQAGHNGVYLLALELLNADAIEFIVGQAINPAYQNPLLPKNISIRRHLVEKICAQLESFNKDVTVDYY
jgi:hypothetical protein